MASLRNLLLTCAATLLLTTWHAGVAGEAPADARKVIVFGELHGTVEMPEYFEQQVMELAARSERPLLIGLEVPQRALEDAKKEAANCLHQHGCGQGLYKSPFWAQSRDGRSSKAYFALIAALHEMELANEVRVVSIDRRKNGREPFGEIAADSLTQAMAGSTVLVLTGNGHARLDGSANSVASALQDRHIPVASLILQGTGGSAWACSGGSCGVMDVPGNECNPAIRPTTRTGQEQFVCLGRLTASPPLVDYEAFNRDGAEHHRSQGE